jgi:hypothetical protein
MPVKEFAEVRFALRYDALKIYGISSYFFTLYHAWAGNEEEIIVVIFLIAKEVF